MKKSIFTISCMLFLLVAMPSFAFTNPFSTQHHAHLEGPKVKVLLAKEVNSALLEVKGSYRIFRKDNGAFLSSGKIGKRFVVHAIEEGLRWGEEYPGIGQICILPLQAETYIYVNGIQYKGAVSVYRMPDNRISVVNEVTIEDFIKSSLTLKFVDSLEKEAMAAIAISARTLMWNNISSTHPWDVTAEEVGYYGYGITQVGSHVEEAVDKTKFMVLKGECGNKIPLKEENFVLGKAKEFAKKGCNAKEILSFLYPHAQISITVDEKLLTHYPKKEELVELGLDFSKNHKH